MTFSKGQLGWVLIPIAALIVISYQNCAPDSGGGGLNFGSSQSQEAPTAGDPLDPTRETYYSTSPARALAPPPSVTGAPADSGIYLLAGDRDWNPGEDTINDPDASTRQAPTREQALARLATITQANTQWYSTQALPAPVTTARIYVMQIARANLKLPSDPAADGRGCFAVEPQDKIWIDLATINASNQTRAKWSNMQHPGIKWYGSNDQQFIYSPRDFQPFYIRVKAVSPNADAYFYATINGVRSNTLCLTTKPTGGGAATPTPTPSGTPCVAKSYCDGSLYCTVTCPAATVKCQYTVNQCGEGAVDACCDGVANCCNSICPGANGACMSKPGKGCNNWCVPN